MLIAIDGSDSKINKRTLAFGRSNFAVQNFANDYQGPGKVFYSDGPTGSGMGVESIRNRALEFAKTNYVAGEQVNLIGFSRGGLIAVDVAESLGAGQFVWPPEKRRAGTAIKVKFLGLYDAVNRTIWQLSAIIPSNVENAYHAVRDPKNGSRWYFGNTARKVVSDQTTYTEKIFATTHAGIGGAYEGGDRVSYVPWASAMLSPSIMLYQSLLRAKGARIPGPENSFQRLTLEEAMEGSVAADEWMRLNAAHHGVQLPTLCYKH